MIDTPVNSVFPRPLESYIASPGTGLGHILAQRIADAPFNLVATGIFAIAIVHTFTVKRFQHWSHRWQDRHDAIERAAGRPPGASFGAEMLHFLGEVEVVFGLWAVVLGVAIAMFYSPAVARHYVGESVDYTEATFVFVIMVLALSEPIIVLAERILTQIARLGGRTPAAWWLTILIVGPFFGSLITEPGAMTICALLLSRQVYARGLSRRLAYATLGLLFVNISIAGALTDFAAPPILMVASAWNWDTKFLLLHFGWKTALAVPTATAIYFAFFRQELRGLATRTAVIAEGDQLSTEVPNWVIAVNAGFMVWTVRNAHDQVLFLGGLLFFLGFAKATARHQRAPDLGAPLLVGFFLAGLLIHGGLQGWWIAPVIASLREIPLFLGAATLTAFNDNALITYLATLVPHLDESLKLAVVAGAVSAGGLTVIANAPNPAGQAILSRWFDDGISPMGLLAGALLPTIVAGAALMLL